MDNEQWFVLRSESRMIVPHLKTEFERRKRAVAEFGILQQPSPSKNQFCLFRLPRIFLSRLTLNPLPVLLNVFSGKLNLTSWTGLIVSDFLVLTHFVQGGYRYPKNGRCLFPVKQFHRTSLLQKYGFVGKCPFTINGEKGGANETP